MKFVTTSPGADPIRVDVHLEVSPAAVFRAWTQVDSVRRWFGVQPGALARAEIDLRPGGRWRFTEHMDASGSLGFEGVYLTIEPASRLLFTWSRFSVSGGVTHTTELSQVEIRFVAVDGGTRMTVVHSALDDVSRARFPTGWEAGVGNLVDFLVTGSHPQSTR